MLLNNTYLGIERIDLGTIETSGPELTPPIRGDVTFLATVDAPPSVRAGGDLRGSGVDRRVSLGLTLAARRVRAMLVFAMRLAADWAPCVSSASDSRVTPTPAVLAERDTGLGGCSTNEALPPEDDDALVDQALRTGPVLGIPDVEVGCSRGATVGRIYPPRPIWQPGLRGLEPSNDGCPDRARLKCRARLDHPSNPRLVPRSVGRSSSVHQLSRDIWCTQIPRWGESYDFL